MDAAAALFGGRLPLAQTYARLLSTSGVERGLIGPREVPRLWDRHLLNCAAVHEIIPPGASVADVGSGAGLPGIVLAIARPDLRITLIEPLLRRTTWLTEALIELGLDHVSVTRDRADAVAATARRFDIVTARAVAPLPKLVGWCLPLLSPGGELLALKGSSAADELIEAEPLLRRLGASAWSVETCGSNLLVTPTTVLRISVSGSGSPDR